ncbi:hypothetical protein MF672_041690 [Actinomadura sp. ATCC 31491]|uniref:Copper chaperone PCu(A)C n=1 Tax=Actinomadura luzonensis TaxID=2805427 RepID=A0ABT0G6Q5_9ACTN|nr:hypothetical protein [Actinomadura luzonensis]MCK2220269.1 hypothetical protein [Actinomadura luzonensis]
MRPIASAVTAVALAALAAGCTKTSIDTVQRLPQNEGANADVGQTIHVRNVFLLGGADPASPAPQTTLYGVIVNDGHQPVQLQSIAAEGGGQVQLAAPVTVQPLQPVGVGDRPLGTATGVRGGTVPMTFTFAGAPPVRVIVPVKPRTGFYANLTPAPSGPATPAPSPSRSPTASASPSPTS